MSTSSKALSEPGRAGRAIAPRVTGGNGQPPSTRTLVSGVFSDAADVVRAEVKLAALEIRQDVKNLAATIPIGAVGAVFGLLGSVFGLWAVMLALDLVLPAWAAALIVGAIALVAAVVCMAFVRRRITDWKAFVPERTLEMLAENRQWMRQKLS